MVPVFGYVQLGVSLGEKLRVLLTQHFPLWRGVAVLPVALLLEPAVG